MALNEQTQTVAPVSAASAANGAANGAAVVPAKHASKPSRPEGEGDLSFLDFLTAVPKGLTPQEQKPQTHSSQASLGFNAPPVDVNLLLKSSLNASTSSNPVEDPEAVKATEKPETAPKSEALKKEDLSLADVQWLQKVMAGPAALPLQAGGLQGLIQQNVATTGVNGVSSSLSTESALHGLALSQKMTALLQESMRSGRPVRVSLEDASSLVLRIRQGKVSAEFLPATAAQAALWQASLTELKTRLSQQNLPVEALWVRPDSSQNKPNRQQQEASSQSNEEKTPSANSSR